MKIILYILTIFILASCGNPQQNSGDARADKLFDEQIKSEVNGTSEEHYLYSFADKDILDIIANQSEWTKAEVAIAMKISKERSIELTADKIKGAKKKRNL